MKYAADFETTTDRQDTRVWAWAVAQIGEPENILFGNSVQSLMDWCSRQRDMPTLYFHNLKFDGEFILYWLFKNGYEHKPGERKLNSGEFTTLISDKGQFYSMEICFYREGKRYSGVKIFDSYKVIPFKVSVVAKTFDLPISKLELDYKAYRAMGHELTQEEKEYITNDVTIMAIALDRLFCYGANENDSWFQCLSRV